MEKLESYCGFNCFSCSVRIATINNDENLMLEIQNKLQKINKSPYKLPEFTGCYGCKPDHSPSAEEIKKSGCIPKPTRRCEIATCASDKSCDSCKNCIDYNNCNVISTVHHI